MDENAKVPAAPSLGKWVGLAVAAIILAAGIWGMLVSLTRSLLLPLLARVMGGGDPQSPLYLGKGDLNIPDLFGSIIELCLAGIVFLLIKSWAAKADRVKTLHPVKIRRQPASPALSIAAQPLTAAAQAAAAVPVTTRPSQVAEAASPPEAARPTIPAQATPKPAKPEKPSQPEKPKEVYYNIVGEPINPTEDDQ
jgi:large-conductance mechanosensitive channel